MVKEMKKTGAPDEVPEICRTNDTPDRAAEKRVVLLIAILSGFITPFDGSAVNIALPTIGKEFHMDAIALSWVATAYLLSSAVCLVPFGKIADIYGRKKVFLYGIAIFSLASLLMTMVPSTEMLIRVRVLQGIGSAMIFGTGVAILTSVFPPRERGKVLGIYVTAVYLGLSLGPFLGGIMTHYLGWRSIFFVNVPLGFITVLLILWKLKGDWLECKGRNLTWRAPLYSGGGRCHNVRFSILPDIEGAALIAAGFIGIIIFALYEIRVPFLFLTSVSWQKTGFLPSRTCPHL